MDIKKEFIRDIEDKYNCWENLVSGLNKIMVIDKARFGGLEMLYG